MGRILTKEVETELLRLQDLAERRVAQSPGAGFVADYVQMARALLGWKQHALASLAGVSLSTIQRVERGELVSEESLERIGIALDLEPGLLTEPRIPLSKKQFHVALREWIDSFKGRVSVKVKPLRTHSQVAKLLATHCVLPESKADHLKPTDLHGLIETLGAAAFIRASQEPDSKIDLGKERVRRRELYEMVLSEVTRLEKETRTIALAGTYCANTDVFARAIVGVIVFFDRIKDPGAIKRGVLLAAENLTLRYGMSL